MHQARLPRLERGGSSLQDFTARLQEEGALLYIDTLNWARDFPHRPLVAAYLAYDAEALYVNYRVWGEDMRTLSPGDGHYVHEDSCVECFVQTERGDSYVNFEFNAAGVCYASRHSSPKESTPLSAADFASIERWGDHLGQQGLERTGAEAWQLTVALPWTTIGYAPGQIPTELYANLYKCGDKTAHPHFLSWAPIEEAQPAFHRPQFFGTLILD